MSEDRNEQFAEPLVGREGVEAEFGYKRMPEDKPSAQAEIDIKTAVEELRASRPAEEPIEAIEYKRLENGEKAPENETVSLERAADDLTAYHSQQSVERAKSISEDFAKAIDSMRADALKANPKANDELGLSKQEIAAAKAAKTEAAQDETVPETLEARQEPSEPDAYNSIEGLEPELKEVLRKSPQARQFFESYAAEGEQVKEAYTAGLNNAHQFGQAAILALASSPCADGATTSSSGGSTTGSCSVSGSASATGSGSDSTTGSGSAYGSGSDSTTGSGSSTGSGSVYGSRSGSSISDAGPRAARNTRSSSTPTPKKHRNMKSRRIVRLPFYIRQARSWR